jgi:periplasmic protein TonB
MNRRQRRSGQALGFVVSTLLHGGLMAAVLMVGPEWTRPAGDTKGMAVPVTLTMFAGVTPAAPAAPTTAALATTEPRKTEPEPSTAAELPPPIAAPLPATPLPIPRPPRLPTATKTPPKPKPRTPPKPKSATGSTPPGAESTSAARVATPDTGSAAAIPGGASAAAPAPAAGTSAPDPVPQRDPEAIARSEAAYLEGLGRAVAAHKFFPETARRQRLEGQVIVEFVLEGSGRIARIRVRRGSGHELLDQAALQVLQELGHYEPIPHEFGRTRWELSVPIRFSLVNAVER